MESGDVSNFSESVLKAYDAHWTSSSFDANASFTCGTKYTKDLPQCSTPLAQTLLCKNDLLKKIHFKPACSDSTINSTQNNTVVEENNNTVVNVVNKKPRSGSHTFICELFDAINSESENSESSHDTLLENTHYITLDSTHDDTLVAAKEEDETLVEVSTEEDEDQEEDVTLLISSDEEEQADDVDTFIHLLDSPPGSPTLVSPVDNPPTPDYQTPSVNISVPIPVPNIKSKDVVNSLNNLEKPRKVILSRSVALKQYLKQRLHDQVVRYPYWLEQAKYNIHPEELLDLVNTVYLPLDIPHRNHPYQLLDLTTKNYRQVLQDCGRNPNRSPYVARSASVNDFFNMPINKNNNRFINTPALMR